MRVLPVLLGGAPLLSLVLRVLDCLHRGVHSLGQLRLGPVLLVVVVSSRLLRGGLPLLLVGALPLVLVLPQRGTLPAPCRDPAMTLLPRAQARRHGCWIVGHLII